MRRLLLVLAVGAAGILWLMGGQLRTALAATEVHITLGPAELHPTQQALNFLLDAPDPGELAGKRKTRLWATYYHMPTVRPASGGRTGRPLLGRDGQAVSPPLSTEDWCNAAMQGSIWVHDGKDKPTAYMFVDSNGPEQVVCDAYFGELSEQIKSATRKARFVPFHHPQACDVRVIPLMPFRTIAVDRLKIRMGTIMYIPQLRGETFWSGGEFFTHDGYVIASDTGGAIEGNHIDMFVADAAVDPFPNIVKSHPGATFDAYIVDPGHPAAVALTDAAEDVCKDTDGPGRKRRNANPV